MSIPSLYLSVDFPENLCIAGPACVTLKSEVHLFDQHDAVVANVLDELALKTNCWTAMAGKGEGE